MSPRASRSRSRRCWPRWRRRRADPRRSLSQQPNLSLPRHPELVSGPIYPQARSHRFKEEPLRKVARPCRKASASPVNSALGEKWVLKQVQDDELGFQGEEFARIWSAVISPFAPTPPNPVRTKKEL